MLNQPVYAVVISVMILRKFLVGGITPPFHQANPPTTASFLCAYRDTEHGCKFN
jgi:hypothetical protein